MSKVVSVQLTWKYSPENYLEEPISIELVSGVLEIKDGVALIELAPEVFHADQSISSDLTKKVESRLVAVQIMTHKNFELTTPSRTDIREDGTKNQFVEVKFCSMATSVMSGDVVVKDKSGKIISDTKTERLDKQADFAALVEKHRASDATLDHMLKSYQQSVKDPSNELVHLYEIRDALSEAFGSKKAAIAALDITANQWDEIGKLANSLPLQQGRHRGQAAGVLRSAEPKELEIARKSVSCLVEKYLNFLETCSSH
tara:strand:- start:43 stop:816 length:774 start_codon:yes stop_codon:yes gene_type:complete